MALGDSRPKRLSPDDAWEELASIVESNRSEHYVKVPTKWLATILERVAELEQQ